MAEKATSRLGHYLEAERLLSHAQNSGLDQLVRSLGTGNVTSAAIGTQVLQVIIAAAQAHATLAAAGDWAGVLAHD